MVRVRDDKFFRDYQRFKGSKPLKGLDIEGTIGKYISLQFSHLFIGYTQDYNKRYERKGSLFSPRVKRKAITNNNYFTALIVYIHQNTVHHGFVDDLRHWLHSSCTGILEGNDPVVHEKEIIDWFGDKAAFIDAHKITKGIMSTFD